MAQNIPTVLGSPVTKEPPSAKLSEAEEEDRGLLRDLQKALAEVNRINAALKERNVTVQYSFDRFQKEGKPLTMTSATKHLYWTEKELQGAAK